MKKFIKKFLQLLRDETTRAKYIRSYKQHARDAHILEIAEEGITDYMIQLDDITK